MYCSAAGITQFHFHSRLLNIKDSRSKMKEILSIGQIQIAHNATEMRF